MRHARFYFFVQPINTLLSTLLAWLLSSLLTDYFSHSTTVLSWARFAAENFSMHMRCNFGRVAVRECNPCIPQHNLRFLLSQEDRNDHGYICARDAHAWRHRKKESSQGETLEWPGSSVAICLQTKMNSLFSYTFREYLWTNFNTVKFWIRKNTIICSKNEIFLKT